MSNVPGNLRRTNGRVTAKHPDGYGLGWCAREARQIAQWMARRLPPALPPGPGSAALIRRVAELCPYVLSEPQCRAVVAGFEGRWPRVGGSMRIRVCRSAGRQLAALRESLS